MLLLLQQALPGDIFSGMDEQYQHECMDHEKVELEELGKSRSGSLENPSQNLKCFYRCIMEKMGIMKEGKLLDDKVAEMFNKNQNKDDALHVYNECKSMKGANDCDTAFKVTMCLDKTSM